MAAFANLQIRVNDAIVRHLADVSADFGSGLVVDGLFSAPYGEAFGLVAGNRPTFSAPASALAAVTVGRSVTINGTAYVVSERQPAGDGWQVLNLDEA